VLIYRLVSKHTIESKIMQRASEKRQLEALVIAKGKFKVPIGGNAKAGEARLTIAEMAAQLLELEGEHIEVVQGTAAGKRGIISEDELEMLLDRRAEVFEGRGVGWKSGAVVKGKKNKGEGESAGDDCDGRDVDVDGRVLVSPAAAVERAALGGGARADGGLFEVYEAPVDEGNDALAHMLGEDVVAP